MHSIRQAKTEDIPEIANLELIAFGGGGHTQVSLRQLFDLFPSLLVIAEDTAAGNAIIGYALGGVSRQNNAGWILAVASHPNHRGCRIGAALTKEILDRLLAEGVMEVFLTVAPDNRVATSLYARYGFSERERIDNYFFDGHQRLLMSYLANS